MRTSLRASFGCFEGGTAFALSSFNAAIPLSFIVEATASTGTARSSKQEVDVCQSDGFNTGPSASDNPIRGY